MGDAATVLLVIGVAIGVGLVLWFQWQANKKKVAEFTAAATQRGWRYADSDRSLIARFHGDPFTQGRARQARHVLSGAHRGRTLVAFQYSYMESHGSGDNRSAETYYFTVVGVATSAARPTLEPTREGIGRKLLGLVGVRDLQLESEEFNQAFHIRTDSSPGADKFAYDILAVVDHLLDYACDILDRTPDFVWKSP